MLYLGIDQHARQIAISLRDESGDVLQARQVSTRPEKIQAFFAKLTRECVRDGESFIAVVEVCGCNDWLIRLLRDFRCHKVILIQPEERKKRKTDRRDAAALSELLWVNRDRFLAEKPVRGLRQVDIATPTDNELAKCIQLLKEENKVLRARVPGQFHMRPGERERLLKFGKANARLADSAKTSSCWKAANNGMLQFSTLAMGSKMCSQNDFSVTTLLEHRTRRFTQRPQRLGS